MRFSVGLEGVINARELGGIEAIDGRRVREGVLIRSGKLGHATDGDIQRLKSVYNLAMIIDMRTTREIQRIPDPVIEGVRYFHLTVLNEDSGENEGEVRENVAFVKAGGSVETIVNVIREGIIVDNMYMPLLSSKHMQNAYYVFFEKLLECPKGAVLWHCTGGKDRTGLAACLLLTALGVDRNEVLRDFELSNLFRRKIIDRIMSEAHKLTDDRKIIGDIPKLVGVDPMLLDAVFDGAEQRYGSMMDFIMEAIGVTSDQIEALRNRFLE